MSLSKATTLFPHNIGLGAAHDPALVEAVARATAIETSSCGVFWAFAPCVAVVGDARWGRTYESFGAAAAAVTANGVAHINGLLGAAVDSWGTRVPGTVAACAKHYVGDGGVAYGTGQIGEKLLDRGDVQLSEAEFQQHLRPYVEAVKAGVMSIMVSFSSVHGKQMHAHKALIEGVLRGEMGFKGLIVSDWAGHDQLREGSTPVEKVSLCMNAGVDLIMIPEHYTEYRTHMEAALADGLLSPARLDEACSRVLRLKYQLGLFESPTAALSNRSLLPQIRCPAHLALARRAVQQSVVLLKNQACVLPLDAAGLQHVFVCGKGADDVGLTCGGWSTSWQGASGCITEGKTILAALAEALPAATITHKEHGKGLDPATHQVALCVVAEDPPYAEWFGDRVDLSLSKEDQHVLDQVTGKGVPVVVVQLAGRPLLARDDWASMDALLHAWLPGSEGGYGIVDILLGHAQPTGTMPLSLPRDLEVADATRTMFARGQGLTYEKTGNPSALSSVEKA